MLRTATSFRPGARSLTRKRHFSITTVSSMPAGERENIAIVGAGAIGGYYGSRLWESNAYNVSFYARSREQYDAFSEKGLTVTSILGDIHIPAQEMNVYQSTNDIGTVDWVVVCVKSTAMESIPALIEPLLSPDTRVIAIMNGLVEDDLIRLLKQHMNDTSSTGLACCRAIYGGMGFICCNRIDYAHVDHSFAGPLNAGTALSASTDSSNTVTALQSDQNAIEQLWAPTKVKFTYEESLTRGRWMKNVWNLPFSGISVAMGGITVDKIVNDAGLRQLALDIMDETVNIANAELGQLGIDKSQYLGAKEKELAMGLSDTMGAYRTSTMIDYVNRKPMEVQYLFTSAVKRAKVLNVDVPKLETIVTQIEALQRLHNLF